MDWKYTVAICICSFILGRLTDVYIMRRFAWWRRFTMGEGKEQEAAEWLRQQEAVRVEILREWLTSKGYVPEEQCPPGGQKESK